MVKKVLVVVEDGSLVKKVKNILDNHGKLDKSQKISKKNGEFIIPTTYESINEIELELEGVIRYETVETKGEYENNHSLSQVIIQYLQIQKISPQTIENLISKIPKKYTLYPPLLLINNQDTFDSIEWKEALNIINQDEFFQLVLKQFPQITHIAINKPIIEQDIMRRPFNISPIYGDFGPDPTDQMFDSPTQSDFDQAFWCTVVQNGIFQSWAPRYTMFSRGNIKEKARILNNFKDVQGTSVIDMYAGIGYFTLSYLKLGASRVFCFELNPWSIQGLIKGVSQNGFTYRVVGKDEVVEFDPNVKCWIFNESNEQALERLRQFGIKHNLSHINLGLLPSSRQSWDHTLTLINKFSNRHRDLGTSIHIHENISDEDLSTFMDSTAKELGQLPLIDKSPNQLEIFPLHLEKIKTFAPGVWHICADFLVK
ncbi:tRNA wybutosine-synthesizing protein [Wickerhamomyces ciferrii]|uniref:tRNA wybutosine-synthesizing protein 2 n=1 Tax=Wickerhamomyces ciferrii (strain ATCC 14091 / BCRC 22168 / CBS 111 / JCM 3599 / NBRC 0793 / NRRL Y-1031 F-60-10) TaxID=1206466 RepID=K0KIN2_WICCF|nr:tRNA wybutosine-synthesizing protein [Wickerhamomyces ciferrii]CCH42037.1 tRNA wybutosine-synthesizing protein [Wickerhamomyces ciferrii]